MAKFADNTVYDAAFGIVDNTIRMVACSAQPANFAGIAAVNLAQVTLAPADFTIAADTSGRKVTVTAKPGVSITTSGDATHISLDDGTTLLYVTTCTLQTLTSGNTVNFPAWKINIQAPT
jgi:hypothetical protein